MENKNLVGVVLAITVSLICIGTVMMPVLTDATATEKTFINEGLFNYGIFDTSDTYTLSADYSNPETITVNGEEMANPLGTTVASYSLISSDDFLVRFAYNGNYQLTVVGLQSNDTATRMYMTNLTATAENGVMTVTGLNANNVEQTATFNYTEFYGIVPDEDEAVLKVPTDGAYILGDSPIYASGLTPVSQWSDMFHFEGTYDDGITITSPNLPDATFDNIEWNIEPVDGYVDLYKLTSIEFDIYYNDTTVHATYSYFAVPTEVTAELSSHLSSSEIALIMIIPVMTILAVLMVAVRVVTRD